MSLTDHYLELCELTSDINEHLPTFVRLVEELRAQAVIELGTRTGVSTVAWLYALEQTGGKLWSVDIDKAPNIGRHAHWTFLQGDDCSEAIYRALPEKADIVFIDTSHGYRHTLGELLLYQWRVRPGGRILLHDTELKMNQWGEIYPVRRAVEDFCSAADLKWSNDPKCNGLGMIEVG